MAFIKWIFIAAATGYLGIGALMYFTQRALMYFPDRARTPPAAAGFPQAQEVVLGTADGERVIAWHVPPRGEKPVVLYFHGNGGSLAYRVDRFQKLVANGTGLLALSYRGYGGAGGPPARGRPGAGAGAAFAFWGGGFPGGRPGAWGGGRGGR